MGKPARGAEKNVAPKPIHVDKSLQAFLRDGWCQRSSGGGGDEASSKPQAWAVGLEKATLRFSNSALDGEWTRLVRARSKALWMRSLLSAAVYQALRHAAEKAQYGDGPRETAALRLVLVGAQLLLYGLASYGLVAPTQRAIFANALGYGVVEFALVVARLRPRVAPGDWLWLTYGLAWFVVPKMSALQFFPACVGSALIVAWWTFLTVATMRPRGNTFLEDIGGLALGIIAPWRRTRRLDPGCVGVSCAREALASLASSASAAGRRTSWADASAGFALAVPVVVLFNVVAYSSEKSVKERFVLRSALAHEHNHDVRVSLLSPDPKALGEAASAHGAGRLVLATLPCALLALLGWFPAAQRFAGDAVAASFGGAEAAWAALTHVAGLTLFLLVLTRRVSFLLWAPLVGLTLLYLTAQLAPEGKTSIFRYGGSAAVLGAVLGGAGLAARGARTFAALLGFARRTLFLYPHLAADLRQSGENLASLVASVDLPRPPSTGAVCEAAASTPARSPAVARRSLGDAAADATLPILPLGSTRSACGFCSRDQRRDARSRDDTGGGVGACAATHAVPVCAAWASWYLARAEAAAESDRVRSERGGADGGGQEAPGVQRRPCCDFALLALERASLHRELARLRRENDRLRGGGRPGA